MSRALVALLLLAACSRPLPRGVERLSPPSSNFQSFSWSPSSRRLAYIDGRFPNRTYLTIFDLASKRRTRTRLKGYVLGGSLALSRDGRRVLLDAGKITANASRQGPIERVLLLVESDGGRIVSETPIGSGGAVSIAHPAWSASPIAAWNDRKRPVWKSFGAAEAGGALDGRPAWRGLLLDAPYLVVTGRSAEPARLTAYDLRDGRRVQEWPAALSVAALGPRPNGAVLAARWLSETGRYVLESCDPATGRREPLLEADGEIETAVETDLGLFAVAKDKTRRNDSGKDFLAPRVLLALENDGRRWSVPWTEHRGALLGSDPNDGRLIFAVTDLDKPGAWAIAPTPEALSAAARAIDGQ